MNKEVFYSQEIIEEFLTRQGIAFSEVIPYICSVRDFEIKLIRKVVKKLRITNSSFKVFDFNGDLHYEAFNKDLSKQWVQFIKSSLQTVEEKTAYYECLKEEILDRLTEETSDYLDEIAYFQKKIDERKKAHKRSVVSGCDDLKLLAQEFGVEEKPVLVSTITEKALER